MKYAKLKLNNTFDYFITDTGNIEWDDTHLCPVKALTQAEALLFRVVTVTEIPQPIFNELTHKCEIVGAIKFGNIWQDNWVATALTAEEIQEKQLVAANTLKVNVINAVQNLLDTTARTRNYDSILSASTYATSSNVKFKAEADACILWRDSVWTTCYEILDDVQNELRAIPTIEEVLSELPVIVWPV